MGRESFVLVRFEKKGGPAVVSSRLDSSGFPLGLENGKASSSQGILNRLEKSGEITKSTGKLGES